MATDTMSNLERHIASARLVGEIGELVAVWNEIEDDDTCEPNSFGDNWHKEMQASTLRELVKKSEELRQIMEGGWHGFDRP